MYDHSQPSGGSGTPPATTVPFPVDVRRLLRVVRARHRRLLAVALLSGVLGLLAALTLAPREYQSETVLEADVEALRRDGGDVGRELRSLADAVKTHDNLARIRHALDESMRLDSLARRIDVAATERSNLLFVRARGSTPGEARRLAQTVTTVFLDSRREQDRAAREDAVAQLGIAKTGALAELERRRAAYEEFRTRNRFLDLAAERQLAVQEAARLRADASTAEAEALSEQARATALSEAADKRSAKVVLSERQVDPAASRLAETETEIAGLRQVLAEDHPRMRVLAAQAELLRAGLKKSRRAPGLVADRVVGRDPAFDVIQGGIVGAEAQRDAARQRSATLAKLADEAERRVAELAALEGRGGELLEDVKQAEQHLADIVARQSRALEAAQTPSPGLRIAMSASLPEHPARSRRRVVALLVAAAAFLFGLGAVLADGLRGLRVHTAVEAAFWGRSPVVCSTAAGADQEQDLALDVGEPLNRLAGTTLVLAAGARELEWVGALAARMGWPLLGPDAVGAPAPVPARGPCACVRLLEGAALRRAARRFDRVLVVVASGDHGAAQLWKLPLRVGRSQGLALVLVGVPPELADLADVAGESARFWQGETSQLRGLAA